MIGLLNFLGTLMTGGPASGMNGMGPPAFRSAPSQGPGDEPGAPGLPDLLINSLQGNTQRGPFGVMPNNPQMMDQEIMRLLQSNEMGVLIKMFGLM